MVHQDAPTPAKYGRRPWRLSEPPRRDKEIDTAAGSTEDQVRPVLPGFATCSLDEAFHFLAVLLTGRGFDAGADVDARRTNEFDRGR